MQLSNRFRFTFELFSRFSRFKTRDCFLGQSVIDQVLSLSIWAILRSNTSVFDFHFHSEWSFDHKFASLSETWRASSRNHYLQMAIKLLRPPLVVVAWAMSRKAVRRLVDHRPSVAVLFSTETAQFALNVWLESAHCEEIIVRHFRGVRRDTDVSLSVG